MVLAKKVKQMKTNYARTMQNNTAANNNNMCGSTGSNQANMCGGQNSGGGIDPNILNMLMNSGANMGGANPMNSANPMNGNMNAANNPLNNMAGMGGNPMQNILLQSLLNGGGNGMNMCGNGGGGMC